MLGLGAGIWGRSVEGVRVLWDATSMRGGNSLAILVGFGEERLLGPYK